MQHQRMSLYSDRLSIEFDAKYMHNHRRAKNGKLHARVQRNQWGVGGIYRVPAKIMRHPLELILIHRHRSKEKANN